MYNPQMQHVDKRAFDAVVTDFKYNPRRIGRYMSIIESDPDADLDTTYGSFEMLSSYYKRIVGDDFENDYRDTSTNFDNNVVAKIVVATIRSAFDRYTETAGLDTVPNSIIWNGVKTLLKGETYSEVLYPSEAQIGLEFEGNKTFERNWRGRAYKIALHIFCELVHWNPFYVFDKDLFADYVPGNFIAVIPPTWRKIETRYPDFDEWSRKMREIGADISY